MSIPWIAVFSESEYDHNHVCDMLNSIFGGLLVAKPVTIQTVSLLPEQPRAVIVNHFSKDYVYRYFPNSKAIYANRFLSGDNLEQVVALPPGERVLVVSTPKAIAEETVDNLRTLGIHHLELTPYWPGCDVNTDEYDTVVHVGHFSILPPGKKRYIDLGHRYLSQSTLAEIIKVYDLPARSVDLHQVHTLHQIVDGLYRIQNALGSTRTMKENFEQICFLSTNAILNLDQNGQLLVFNPAAEKLFALPCEQAIGRNYREALAPHKQLLRLIDSRSESHDQFLHVRGTAVLVSTRFFTAGEESYTTVSLMPVDALKDSEEKARAEIHKKGFIARHVFEDIKGDSPAIRRTVAQAGCYAGSSATVLITGESGTGKELFAQAIHNASNRASGPFVAANFAAIPENLIESELFGYDEGAFTGAAKGGKPGLFRSAHRGTLFLDEIGDASPFLQSRLLRAIEAREIMPVGSARVIPVDVRIICATNKNLAQMVAEGKFREDLYYRLKVFKLHVPPLRERVEDIPLILDDMTGGIPIPAELRRTLSSYSWPGNIRELRGVAQYLTLFAGAQTAEPSSWLDALSDFFEQPDAAVSHPAPQQPELRPDELAILRAIYEMTLGGQTAGRGSLALRFDLKQLGLTEAKLKTRLKRLEELGCLSAGRTRQGVTLTARGLELAQKQECPEL